MNRFLMTSFLFLFCFWYGLSQEISTEEEKVYARVLADLEINFDFDSLSVRNYNIKQDSLVLSQMNKCFYTKLSKLSNERINIKSLKSQINKIEYELDIELRGRRFYLSRVLFKNPNNAELVVSMVSRFGIGSFFIHLSKKTNGEWEEVDSKIYGF